MRVPIIAEMYSGFIYDSLHVSCHVKNLGQLSALFIYLPLAIIFFTIDNNGYLAIMGTRMLLLSNIGEKQVNKVLFERGSQIATVLKNVNCIFDEQNWKR